MKVFKRFRYPKFFIFILTLILAYMLFSDKSFLPARDFILSSGLFGLFIAGIFFDYGFTSAPAVAVFLILAPQYNIFLATIVAGAGSVIGDLLIFKLIKFSFSDEIRKFNKEKLVKDVEGYIPARLRHFLSIILAGFIIASPLPDEIGVPLLVTAYHKLSTKGFALLSFILHTLMIFIILLIGNGL